MNKNLIFVFFIIGVIFIFGCAADYEDESKVFVTIGEDNQEEPLGEAVEEQVTDVEDDEVNDENVPEEIIKEDIQEEQAIDDDPTALEFNPDWGNCEDKDAKFTFSPIDPEVIEFIEPMGLMHPSHPFPTKHMYISDDIGWDGTGRTTYDIVAPADGLIINIGATSTVNDYNMIIWYSCSLVSYFLHVADLTPEIRAITGELQPGTQWDPPSKGAIPVKAGQRIARSKGTFDFGVLDSKVSLTGWIFPTHQGGGGANTSCRSI